MPSLWKFYVNVNDVRNDRVILENTWTNNSLCKLIKKNKNMFFTAIVNVHTTFWKLTNRSAGILQAKNVDVDDIFSLLKFLRLTHPAIN